MIKKNDIIKIECFICGVKYTPDEENPAKVDIHGEEHDVCDECARLLNVVSEKMDVIYNEQLKDKSL